MAKFIGVICVVERPALTKESYPMLYAFMEEFDQGLRFDDRTFLLDFDGSAEALKDALRRFVFPKDILLVFAISDAAWQLDPQREEDIRDFLA